MKLFNTFVSLFTEKLILSFLPKIADCLVIMLQLSAMSEDVSITTVVLNLGHYTLLYTKTWILNSLVYSASLTMGERFFVWLVCSLGAIFRI